jgi:DNA-binding response OmpR family regulator
MRILVVEDLPAFANAIAEGLRDQAMAVDVAYDGHEAAAKLDLNRYDVIVLDRDLPGIHGDTLCKMIADTEDGPMILMLTASGAPAERVAGLSLGADDYLPKPFHFPELVLRVHALARRKPKAHGRILQAAGIELDRRARSAAQSQPRRPQRRATAPTGMGRERRPVHQHRQSHDREASAETRRAPGHPTYPWHRLPNHRHTPTSR